MSAEQRVKMAIGDLVIQLQAALAKIAELQEEVAMLREELEKAGINVETTSQP